MTVADNATLSVAINGGTFTPGTVSIGSGATFRTTTTVAGGSTVNISNLTYDGGTLDIGSGVTVHYTPESLTVGSGKTLTTTGGGAFEVATLENNGGTMNIGSHIKVTGGGTGTDSNTRKKGLYLHNVGGTVNLTGTAEITGAMYASEGSVVIGDGTHAARVETNRVEFGDTQAAANASTLTINANATLHVKAGDVGSSYSSTGILLGEWEASSTLNIYGNLYADQATAYVGDKQVTYNIENGGVMAVKGIGINDTGSGKASKSQTINLNLKDGGKLVLGASGISSNKAFSANFGHAEVGMTADTTLAKDITLTSAEGTTFNTAKYTWQGQGDQLTLAPGTAGGTMTVSGSISGSGPIFKTGAGTLTLSGANSGFTGATNVNEGTLAVANATALAGSAVTMAAGTTLDLQVSGSTTISALSLAGTADSVAGATLKFKAPDFLTVTGGLSVGTGTIFDVGNISYSATPVTLANVGSFTGSIDDVTLVNVQGDYVDTTTLALEGNALVLHFGLPESLLVWDNNAGTGLWSTAEGNENWHDVSSPEIHVAYKAESSVQFTSTATATLAEDVVVDALNIDHGVTATINTGEGEGAHAMTVSSVAGSGATLALGGEGTAHVTGNVELGTLTVSGGSNTFDGPATITTMNVSGGTTTVAGASTITTLNAAGGTTAIHGADAQNKATVGTLNISSASATAEFTNADFSFTSGGDSIKGNVTIGAGARGIVTATDSLNWRSGTDITILVEDGGTLDFGNNRWTIQAHNKIVLDNGHVTGNGQSTNGTLDFDSNGGRNVLEVYGTSDATNIRVRGDNNEFHINEGGTFTITGRLNDSGTQAGGLIKTGTGALVVQGAMSYTHDTTVSEGTLTSTGTYALAAGRTLSVADGATASFSGAVTIGKGATFSVAETGTLTFGSTVAVTGDAEHEWGPAAGTNGIGMVGNYATVAAAGTAITGGTWTLNNHAATYNSTTGQVGWEQTSTTYYIQKAGTDGKSVIPNTATKLVVDTHDTTDTGVVTLGDKQYTNITSLEVRSGVVSTTRGGASAGLINGAITVNGGATFRIAGANDALGYGSGVTSVTLNGTDADHLATLDLAMTSGSETMHANLVLNGHARITDSGAQHKGFNTFGGSITATGTNNVIERMQMRKPVTVTVNSGADLVVNTLENAAQNETRDLTKNGAGSLTIDTNTTSIATLTVNAGEMTVKSGTYSIGSLNMNNATADTVLNLQGGTVTLGATNTMRGTINIAGTVTMSGNFDMSRSGNSSTATVRVQSGGTLDVGGNSLWVGPNANLLVEEGGTFKKENLTMVGLEGNQGSIDVNTASTKYEATNADFTLSHLDITATAAKTINNVLNHVVLHTGGNAVTVANSADIIDSATVEANGSLSITQGATIGGTIESSGSVALAGTVTVDALNMDKYVRFSTVAPTYSHGDNGFLTSSSQYYLVWGQSDAATVTNTATLDGGSWVENPEGAGAGDLIFTFDTTLGGIYYVNTSMSYAEDADQMATATGFDIKAGATLTIPTGTTVSNKVIHGAGTYSIGTSSLGTGVSLGADWTGIVSVSGSFSASFAAIYSNLANENSWVEFTGYTGFDNSWASSSDSRFRSLDQNIILENSGNAPAWNFTAAASSLNYMYATGVWKGHGTFKMSGDNKQGVRFSNNISGWEGILEASINEKHVQFTENANVVNAQINVTAGTLAVEVGTDVTFNKVVNATTLQVEAGKTAKFNQNATFTNGITSAGTGTIEVGAGTTLLLGHNAWAADDVPYGTNIIVGENAKLDMRMTNNPVRTFSGDYTFKNGSELYKYDGGLKYTGTTTFGLADTDKVVVSSTWAKNGVEFAGLVAGKGHLSLAGNGETDRYLFSGSNGTFTGEVLIGTTNGSTISGYNNTAYVDISGQTALQHATVNLAGGNKAILRLANSQVTIGGLRGTSGSAVNLASGTAAATLAISGSGTYEYAGSLASNVGLDITGTGTQKFTAAGGVTLASLNGTGGKLDVTGTLTVDNAAANEFGGTLAVGGLTKSGEGALTLHGIERIGSTITLNGGSLVFGAGNYQLGGLENTHTETYSQGTYGYLTTTDGVRLVNTGENVSAAQGVTFSIGDVTGATLLADGYVGKTTIDSYTYYLVDNTSVDLAAESEAGHIVKDVVVKDGIGTINVSEIAYLTGGIHVQDNATAKVTTDGVFSLMLYGASSFGNNAHVQIEEGAKLSLCHADSAAAVLKAATGTGDIDLDVNATLGNGTTTAAAGTLTIGDGNTLTLGGGESNHVDISSFSSVVLDGGTISYNADQSTINGLTVNNGKTGTLHLEDMGSNALVLDGDTVVNGTLTVKNHWNSLLTVNHLTGSGTFIQTNGSNAVQEMIFAINSLEGFTGAIELSHNKDDDTTSISTGAVDVAFLALTVNIGSHTMNFALDANASIANALTLTSGTANFTGTGSLTVGGLTGSGTMSLPGDLTINVAENGDYSYAGLQSLGGKLTKTGPGAQALTLGTSEAPFVLNEEILLDGGSLALGGHITLKEGQFEPESVSYEGLDGEKREAGQAASGYEYAGGTATVVDIQSGSLTIAEDAAFTYKNKAVTVTNEGTFTVEAETAYDSFYVFNDTVSLAAVREASLGHDSTVLTDIYLKEGSTLTYSEEGDMLDTLHVMTSEVTGDAAVLSGGALTVGTVTGAGIVSVTGSLNAANVAVDKDQTLALGATDGLTIGTVTGLGTLAIESNATITGDNSTFTGGITVNDGVLAVTNINQLGTGTLTANGEGTIQLTSGSLPASITVEGNGYLSLVTGRNGSGSPVKAVTAANLKISDSANNDSRIVYTGASDLSGVDHLIFNGGQLWVQSALEYAGEVTFGATTYRETTNNYDLAAIRVNANTTFTGDVVIAQNAKLTWENASTVTMAGTMAGSGALQLDRQGVNGTFKVSGDASGYTGALTSAAQITVVVDAGAELALGTGTNIGGALTNEGTVTAVGTAVVNGNVTGSGSLKVGSTGSLTLNGSANALTHAIDVEAGGSLTLNGTFDLSGIQHSEVQTKFYTDPDGAETANGFAKSIGEVQLVTTSPANVIVGDNAHLTLDGYNMHYDEGSGKAVTSSEADLSVFYINADTESYSTAANEALQTISMANGTTLVADGNFSTDLIAVADGGRATLAIEKNATVTAGSASKSLTLTGEGTYKLGDISSTGTALLPSGVSLGEDWTGMVEISGSKGPLSFNALSNNGKATVKMAGVSTWFNANANELANFYLVGNDPLGSDWTGTALRLDLSDGRSYTLAGKIYGDGDITIRGGSMSTAPTFNFSGNHSEWEGSLVNRVGTATKQPTFNMLQGGDAVLKENIVQLSGGCMQLNLGGADTTSLTMDGNITINGAGGMIYLAAKADTVFNGSVQATTLTVQTGKSATFNGALNAGGAINVGAGSTLTFAGETTIAQAIAGTDSSTVVFNHDITATGLAGGEREYNVGLNDQKTTGPNFFAGTENYLTVVTGGGTVTTNGRKVTQSGVDYLLEADGTATKKEVDYMYFYQYDGDTKLDYSDIYDVAVNQHEAEMVIAVVGNRATLNVDRAAAGAWLDSGVVNINDGVEFNGYIAVIGGDGLDTPGNKVQGQIDTSMVGYAQNAASSTVFTDAPVENGGVRFTSEAGSIFGGVRVDANATTAGEDLEEYSIGNSRFAVGATKVEMTGATDATIAHSVVVDKVHNSAGETTDKLTLGRGANAYFLKEVSATSGDVEFQNMAEANGTPAQGQTSVYLNNLEIGAGKTVSFYEATAPASVEDMVKECAVTVTETLTVGDGAALNADLVMKSGSVMDVSQAQAHHGLNLGCSLTIEPGAQLSQNDMDQIAGLSMENRWYFLDTSVEQLHIIGIGDWDATQGQKLTCEDYMHVDLDASRVYKQLESQKYALVYNWGGSNVGTYTVAIYYVPEPATSTLSLLALAALAARRRRKG